MIEDDADSTLLGKINRIVTLYLREERTSWVWSLFGSVLIFVAGSAVYYAVLQVPLYDQETQVLQSAVGQQKTDLRVTQGVFVQASFLLNRFLFGEDTRDLRALNLLVHLFTTVLTFLLAKRLWGQKAPWITFLFSSFVFLLYPVAVETLVLVIHRERLLCALFTVLSVHLYLCAFKNDSRVGILPLCLSVTAYLIAAGCHPIGLIVPALILATDWVHFGHVELKKRLITYQTPYWVAFAAFTVLLFANPQTPATEKQPWLEQLVAFPDYLMIAFSGQGVCPVHPQPTAIGINDPAVLFAGLIFVVFIAIGLFLTKQRSIAGLSLVWFVLTLYPLRFTSALDGLPVLSDSRLYLPFVGVVFALPWLFTFDLAKEGIVRKALLFALSLLVIAAGIGAYTRVSLWNDPLALWTETAQMNPNSGYVQKQLGTLFLRQANTRMASLAQNASRLDRDTQNIHLQQITELYSKAEQHLRNAKDMAADDIDTLVMLANSLQGQQKYDDAITLLKEALLRDLRRQDIPLQLASVFQQRATDSNAQQDIVSALDYFRYAESLSPIPPIFTPNYANLLITLGEFERAYALLGNLANTLNQDPSSSSSDPFAAQLGQLGTTVEQLQQLRKEIDQTRKGRSSRDPEVLLREAQYQIAHKRYLQSAYLLDLYLDQRPNDANAWVMCAFAKGMMGAHERFLSERPVPKNLPPDAPSIWMQLAQVCGMNGRWDIALTFLNSSTAQNEIAYPLVVLGDAALQLGQNARAREYFREATTAYAEVAVPWLRLCDIALAERDFTTARGYFAEAEKRGGAESELARRRAILDEAEKHTQNQGPVTVLR